MMDRDWASLPEELVNLISSKIFLPEDQLTFCLVCRSWKAAVSPFYHYPYLTFYKISNYMWKFFQHHNIFHMDFPELLDDTEIRCSKYGWLLMSGEDPPGSLFFFNPFNKQVIQLPCYDDENHTIFCFFNLPTSSDCLVVGMSSYGYRVIISVLKVRGGDEEEEEEWTTFKFDCKPDFLYSCIPILHHGVLYCLNARGDIGIFHITTSKEEDGKLLEDSCSWNVYKKCLSPSRLCSKIQQTFLVKIKGVLYGVFVVHEERRVKVYRLLEPKMKWELVEDLGDKVLFVSNTGSFGGTAPLKSMANKIYFPKFHGKSGVFYSLDTKKYHSFGGDFSSNKTYGLTEIDFATWVMPMLGPNFNLQEN